MSVMAVNSAGSYVELPVPAYRGYSAVEQELTKADRNTLGRLIKVRIAVKMNIEAEWHAITAAQKNSLLALTGANTFQLRYLSTMDDQVHYGEFYRGSDLTVTGYGRYKDGEFQYYDVTTSFVEVRRWRGQCRTAMWMPSRRRPVPCPSI